MKLRHWLLAGVALVGTGSVQSARAQGVEGSALEEVVVTAQRRGESAQDVPIAITAVSGERLANAGITSLPQLNQVTPGLQFQAIGASSVPFLRGVGAAVSSAGAEAPVALMVDGVYVAAQPASLMGLSNIAAVEVDKGPQGTLFGRNATGGVIQIRTKDPSHTPQGEVTLGYGNYNTWTGSFYGTTGLTDTLAIDLALGASDQGDGYGTNLFNGKDIYTSYDYAARSKLQWVPSDATKVTLIASYERLYSETGFATRLPMRGELGLDQRGRLGYQFAGGFYDVALDYPSFNRTKTWGVSLDWQQDLGFANFRSISAYQKLEWIGQVDFDLSPAHGSHQRNDVEQETVSQEFQLLSKGGPDSKLTWVVGAYLFADDSAYHPLSIDYPAGAPVSDTTINSKLETRSWALFGQASYEILPATRLTIGGRYTEDERKLNLAQTSIGPAPGTVILNGSKTFPKTTWKIGLDHRFGENVLVYASATRGFKSGLYNSQNPQPTVSGPPLAVNPETIDAYEVGLKSDLFDNRLRLNLAAFYYDYQDQQVNAFLGATRLLLNAAGSEIKGLDYEVIWATTDRLNLTFSGSWLDAEYSTFPGAPRFTPVPAPGVGNAVAPINAGGNDVVNSPEFTATFAADYTMDIGSNKLILNGNVYYNSGFYFDFANTREQDAYTLVNASAKLVIGEGERWDVTLWGNNLTDEKVYASVNQVGLGPAGLFGGDSITPRPPRTFGVRVGMKFGGEAPPPPPPPPAPPPPSPPPPPPPAYEAKEFIVYFPFDQYVLTPEAQAVVSQAADYAKGGAATRIVVVGHADTSGSAAYNVRLSERRAKATADALVAGGVAQTALSVDWKGETQPAVQTGDGVKEPLNRRATIGINF